MLLRVSFVGLREIRRTSKGGRRKFLLGLDCSGIDVVCKHLRDEELGPCNRHVRADVMDSEAYKARMKSGILDTRAIQGQVY